MPYDQLGNPYGLSEDDLGALEAKYKKPDLASQIPGQVATSRSEEPRSLRDRAVAALTQANPLMMRRSLEDATRTLVGGAALPIVAPISAGIQALNAAPGNMLRRSRGEPEVKTPTTEELMQKYGEAIAPRTEMGRDFQEGLGKAMDVLKVPHAWPVTPNVPRRPLVTPTDVRVGAGQIKQLTKELRETPADFQAAQSGLKRQNLYGEDTIGVKVQAAADALGDTLERRRAAGLSAVPGVPQVLTPDTKLYAVRPKGSRIVQPKVPESAKNFVPEFNAVNDLVSDVYGDTPAAQMPPDMVLSEYAKRYLPEDSELRGIVTNYSKLKAQEMFPDAPTPRDAQRAYDVLFSNRTERNKQQLADIEEFLNLPENAAYRENTPTPAEFMQRMAEAERVIKGPFSTYVSKNIGAEGDPTVKLARQGITYLPAEDILEAADLASPAKLSQQRIEAGFPAMGAFHEERLAKFNELDAINNEIQELEAIRQPLFDLAHEQRINPASIPEYAATTDPLRQKLREREKLQAELEKIHLAQAVENLGDFSVKSGTKESLLKDIPYEQRQFFPSVTKAGQGEKLHTLNLRVADTLGLQKLGKDLVEDILTGKAGDTSKLTIENYMREKGLSRIEAEKAAKLQEQQYRKSLENALVERLKNDQNVQTFGNAAIITLNKDTPRDVAIRDVSADTAVLDHCVGQCGTAPKGRKNVLTGKQQYYEPLVDPITGKKNQGSSNRDTTAYIENLQQGHELVSVRDAKTGLPAATLELEPAPDGRFRIGYASGVKNGAIDPAYIPAIRDYLNSRQAEVYSPGSNLADNAGIFDSTSPAEFKRAAREAGLTNDQVKAIDWGDLPRFVTVDDVKKIAEGFKDSRPPAVVQEAPAPTLTSYDYDSMVGDFNTAWENSAQAALENSSLDRPAAAEGGFNRIVLNTFNQHLNDPVSFTQDGVAQLRRVERDLRNSIESSYAQRTDIDNEIANALEDFLIDVRGIRSSMERRLAAAEARAREQAPILSVLTGDPRQLANNYDLPPATIREIQARRDVPIADLQDMQENARQAARNTIFENLPQENRLAAVHFIQDMIEERNRAQAPAVQGDRMPELSADELLAGYSDRMTPEQREWLTDFVNRWEEDVANFQENGVTRQDRLEAEYGRWLAENRLQRDPLANLFDELEPDETAVANRPALGQAPENRTLAQDYEDMREGLINDFGAQDVRLVDQNELLDAIRNPIEGGSYVDMPRDRRMALADYVERNGFLEPFRAQEPAERPRAELARRDPVPRNMQTMSTPDLTNNMAPPAIRQADEIAAHYFNDNTIDGENVSIGALTDILRDFRVGPHADMPFEVRELAARKLHEMHTRAMMDAEQVADTLNDIFYMDMEPQEARAAIDRDIRLLERGGEDAWEDLVGPMAEDMPWNRNLQYHLIQYLRAIRETREGFAKGGMVKKSKAKKARTTPLVASRKFPELAEMTYRYGGMVC